MKILSRSEAIENLRRAFLALVDDEHSMCEVAAQRGFFCNGLRRWSDAELAQRLRRVVPNADALPRSELEREANRWLLRLQDRAAGRLPCDAERGASPLCAGWDDLYESELAQFHAEICGETVRVVPDVLVGCL